MNKGEAMWVCWVLIILLIVYGIVGEGDYDDQVKIEQAKVGLILGKRYQL